LMESQTNETRESTDISVDQSKDDQGKEIIDFKSNEVLESKKMQEKEADFEERKELPQDVSKDPEEGQNEVDEQELENEAKKLQKYTEISYHLDEIYTEIDGSIESYQMPRYENITLRFEKVYGEKPAYYYRAPGRINLLGEHAVASGYSSIICALEQDTVIAYAPHKENEIIINHTQPSLYPTFTISNDPSQKWKDEVSLINVFLAGYKAVLNGAGLTEFKGMKLLISGDLPISAGLGSSSSLMVASALLALHVNGLQKKTLQTTVLENLVKYEKMLESYASGVDQTVTLLAQKNTAFSIKSDSFEKITLPKGLVFMVTNSLTPTPKLFTQGTRQNKRIVECRIALKMLTRKLDIKDSLNIKTLSELQTFLDFNTKDMLDLLEEHIEKRSYQAAELEKFFETQLMKVVTDIPNADAVINQNFDFFPYHRAYHVLKECERAQKFKELCEKNSEDVGLQLGNLLNESQHSAKTMYDCSSEELEKIITLCQKLGAFGTRMTGGGWGGCCVSLIREKDIQTFRDTIQTEYFMNPTNGLLISDDLDMYVFPSYAGKGATIIDPQYEVWY